VTHARNHELPDKKCFERRRLIVCERAITRNVMENSLAHIQHASHTLAIFNVNSTQRVTRLYV